MLPKGFLRDLRCLSGVIRELRRTHPETIALRQAQRREKRAALSLARYHRHRDRINEERRWRPSPVDLQKAGERVVLRNKKEIERRRILLEKAARRGIVRAAEVKVRKALRRRFDKVMTQVFVGSVSAAVLKWAGASVSEVRAHLESRFKPGMTWDSHSFTGWHIDHIRPIASFDLSDPVHVAACFHYTNLQPLWAKENLDKRDRVG